jgi:hypothetical protein
MEDKISQNNSNDLPTYMRLYDELKQSVEKYPPTLLKPQKMCSILNSLPKEHREVIYLLILHHDQLHQGSNKSWRNNPYKGQTFQGGCGVKFSLTNFPEELKIVITKYLERITQN